MEIKQPIKKLGALTVAGAVGIVGALAFSAQAQAEENTTIHLKDQHREQTAISDQFPQICGENEHIPADKPDDYDGWVFNYPGSKQYGTQILVLTAEFRDEDGEIHTLDTDNDGYTINDKGTLKAYIGAPAGWTLVDAEAVLEGADHTWKSTFVVTHTCPGDIPDEEPSSPGEEPSSPGEEPSSPGEESSAPGEETSPGEASTTPAGGGGTLPTTGAPLTIALVSAAALAAAGAAIFFVMRRRQAAENW